MSAVGDLGVIAKHFEDISGVNELSAERGYTSRDEVR